jgi:hypothetical protein
MEGKSVIPMEITFMDMEDKHKKYGTLRPLRYIYSNPFRFLISSLGLPIFPLRIAERERWQNMPPMIAHQTDRIVTHNKSLCYFKAIYLILMFCFLTTFQGLILSSTRAYFQTDNFCALIPHKLHPKTLDVNAGPTLLQSAGVGPVWTCWLDSVFG